MTLTRRTILGATLALPAIRTARAAPEVLRMGIGTSLAKLDPLMTTIGDEYIYDNLVFNGLTRMATDLACSRTWPRAGLTATTSSIGRSSCAAA